jgi:AcrR family transcriptional regulator
MPKRDAAYMTARRDEILDAASRCLVRDGYAGFSTARLCAEAGISTGGLYIHFPSRDAVLVALAARTARDRAAQLDVSSFGAFRESVARMLDQFRGVDGRARARLNLEIASSAAIGPEITNELRAYVIGDDLRAALVELDRAGELAAGADAGALADTLTALIAGFVSLRALTGEDAPAPRPLLDTLLAPYERR